MMINKVAILGAGAIGAYFSMDFPQRRTLTFAWLPKGNGKNVWKRMVSVSTERRINLW